MQNRWGLKWKRWSHRFNDLATEMKNSVPAWCGSRIYWLDRALLCFLASCNTWVSSANTNYAGGTANSAATVSDCQSACIANSQCIAIDFNPAGGAGNLCWILTSLSGTKFTGTNSGITHYDLSRNCCKYLSLSTVVISKKSSCHIEWHKSYFNSTTVLRWP